MAGPFTHTHTYTPYTLPKRNFGDFKFCTYIQTNSVHLIHFYFTPLFSSKEIKCVYELRIKPHGAHTPHSLIELIYANIVLT